VVRRALALVAIGGALGVLAMPALGRLLTSLLFEVAPGDPATVAAALAILGATAAVAGWVPARRALRLDPVEALRTE
jgi:ABC-type antimicrobial peptide transport system permease subunit